MIELWSGIFVLIVIALLLVVIPLLFNKKPKELANDEVTLQVYRGKLLELKQSLEMQQISDEQYHEAVEELKEQCAVDMGSENVFLQQPDDPDTKPWLLIGCLLVLIPVVSIVLYQRWGFSEALLTKQVMEKHYAHTQSQQAAPAKSMGEVIQVLQAQLEKNPENARNWFLLGRSLVSVQEYALAKTAFAKTLAISGDDPVVMAEYAQAWFMDEKGKITPDLRALLSKILTIEPNQPLIMGMFGIEAMQRADYQAAVEFWRAGLGRLKEDDPQSKLFKDGIAQAEQLLQSGGLQAKSKTSPVTGKQILVKVDIAENLKNKTTPADKIFVFARAVDGPKMPLAVKRLSSSEFPFSVTLDDSLSMSPMAKLSNFDKVIVGVRMSKHNNAMAQKGDLQGYSGIVELVDSGNEVTVTLDHTVN